MPQWFNIIVFSTEWGALGSPKGYCMANGDFWTIMCNVNSISTWITAALGGSIRDTIYIDRLLACHYWGHAHDRHCRGLFQAVSWWICRVLDSMHTSGLWLEHVIPSPTKAWWNIGDLSWNVGDLSWWNFHIGNLSPCHDVFEAIYGSHRIVNMMKNHHLGRLGPLVNQHNYVTSPLSSG